MATIEHWGRFAKGDIVTVDGERGKFKVMSFRLDDEGNCRWASVFGGRSGVSQWRSFAPTRLHKNRKLTKEARATQA